MRIVGYLTAITGLVALLYTGINSINNSETSGVFGVDVAISKGDPLPMFISGAVLAVGLLITRFSKEEKLIIK